MWVRAAFSCVGHSLVRPTQFSRFWEFTRDVRWEQSNCASSCLTETWVQNCNDLSPSQNNIDPTCDTLEAAPTHPDQCLIHFLFILCCSCCHYLHPQNRGRGFLNMFSWNGDFLKIFSESSSLLFCIVFIHNIRQKPAEAFAALTDDWNWHFSVIWLRTAPQPP